MSRSPVCKADRQVTDRKMMMTDRQISTELSQRTRRRRREGDRQSDAVSTWPALREDRNHKRRLEDRIPM